MLGAIEQAVAAAGGWPEVGRFAVGLGPGSFVGIRIGIATARGLALSTGRAVSGVCTLDALGRGLRAQATRSAVPHLARGDMRNSGSVLAVLDARRGEVFAALYGADGSRVWEPTVLAPRALAERVAELPSPPLAGGPGAVRFRDELAGRGVEIPADEDPLHRVAAADVCALASAAGEMGSELEPIYLRPPDAQRWRERDNPRDAG